MSWQLVVALVSAVFIMTSDVSGSDIHWGYEGSHGVDEWAHDFPQCDGKKQSPIDLDSKTALPANFKPLFMGNYDTAEKPMKLTNNGHTVLLSLSSDLSEYRIPYVKDGGLTSTFNLAQLHFHWGSDSSQGSEHTLESEKFAAEIHFVHYNTKYGTFANSTSHPDGLAVVGVFVKVVPNDNMAFQPIVEALGTVVKEGSDTILKKPIILRDLLPTSRSKFYRYSGSLTTPGCQEIVTWTVFETPITISSKQISKFRELTSGEGEAIVNNYRPVQKLQGRSVHVRSSAPSITMASNLLLIIMPFTRMYL